MVYNITKESKSCVINGCHTTEYFKLKRGSWQGDPISAYVFILALEIPFIFIKFEKNSNGVNIFKHEYLSTAYADGTMFFLKNETSEEKCFKWY